MSGVFLEIHFQESRHRLKPEADVLQERVIEEYRNVDAYRSYQTHGLDKVCTKNKRSPKGQTWVDCGLTEKQVSTRTDNTWPERWSSILKGLQHEAKDAREEETLIVRCEKNRGVR